MFKFIIPRGVISCSLNSRNIFRSQNGKKNNKPKASGSCFNFKNVGHQAHECREKNNDSRKFYGHFYNFQKYGQRAHE